MTVPISARLSQLYVGNGVIKRFDFLFRAFQQDDETGIGVRVKVGNEFEYIDTSKYTVTFNQDNLGGYVTFVDAPSPGTFIYVTGKTPVDQLLDITNYDNFYPDAIERALDKLTSILQEWEHLVDFEKQSRILADIDYDFLAQQREVDLKSYVDQMIALVTGNPSFTGVTANFVFDESGNTQEDINNSISTFAPLKTSNTWQQNRDVIQELNDYLYSTKGGGTIQLPAGNFLLKGVFLDSNIKIQMNEATVLEHPDSYDVHVFETRRYQTSGAIAKDSFTLTVSSTTDFKVGALVAIRGAGGLSGLQSTKLVNAISSTDTTNLRLEVTTGFSTSNTLIVDDEIITYTSIAGDGTLGGVVRGALGTVAASHLINAPIGIAMRLLTEIIAISGNTITVLDAAKTSVSSANVFCGSQKVKVIGGTFKGAVQKDVVGWRWAPVAMKLHRFGELDYYAENCEAVFYAETSSDNKFNIRCKDVGKATYEGVTIGACGWLFQQCHRNEVNAKLIGDCWAGIYLDNRTSSGTEYDGSCDENYGTVTCNYSNYDHSLTTTALLIIGGNGNQLRVLGNNVHSVATIKASDQSYTHDGIMPTAQGNVVNISAKRAYRSVICNGGAIGNTLTISQQNVVEAPLIDDANTVLATNAGGGTGNFTRFRNGDYIRPAISFLADPTLGFTREADGSLRLYSGGVEICRWTSTGMGFPDGRAIAASGPNGLKIGTSASQKYGFWGATPIVQPAIGNAASDPATTQTLVNNIRTALINSGLAKIS